MLFSDLFYIFFEGGSDFDVCVIVVGESEDISCPVEFSFQITANFTNMNGTYMIVLKFFCIILKTVLIFFLEYMSTNDEIAHPGNSPFASAYINITFEPCDNEMCVDIGREVGIPLDDDTLYVHRLFNYTILNEKLVLGRPRYDTVIQDDSTGTFLVVDNDGMLPTAFDI